MLTHLHPHAQVNNTDAEGRLTLADALWCTQSMSECGTTAIVQGLYFGV